MFHRSGGNVSFSSNDTQWVLYNVAFYRQLKIEFPGMGFFQAVIDGGVDFLLANP